jgi:[acyl-carrier-protein] S-malonyltransferase
MPPEGAGIAICFPGQGSQRAGMADGLTDDGNVVELLQRAQAQGVGLRAALNGPDEGLRPTEIAQPGLFLVEVALAGRLLEQPGLRERIALVAGHSVGEYAAAAVSGALQVTAAMDLVLERGKLMAAATAGQMSAVLGLEPAAVVDICARAAQQSGSVVVVANDNAPGQVVISGSPEGITAATALAKDRGAKRVVPLPVSGAFHSPLMGPAAQAFAQHLEDASWSQPAMPVVTNADAKAAVTAAELRSAMTRQLSSAVLWRQSVQTMVALGVSTFVEVGPGAVLSGLIRRCAPEVTVMTVNNLADIETVGEELGSVLHG